MIFPACKREADEPDGKNMTISDFFCNALLKRTGTYGCSWQKKIVGKSISSLTAYQFLTVWSKWVTAWKCLCFTRVMQVTNNRKRKEKEIKIETVPSHNVITAHHLSWLGLTALQICTCEGSFQHRISTDNGGLEHSSHPTHCLFFLFSSYLLCKNGQCRSGYEWQTCGGGQHAEGFDAALAIYLFFPFSPLALVAYTWIK